MIPVPCDACSTRESHDKAAMVAGLLGNDFRLGGNGCRSKTAIVADELDSAELDSTTRLIERPRHFRDAVCIGVWATDCEAQDGRQLRVSHVVERPGSESLSSSARSPISLGFAARGGRGGKSAPAAGLHLSGPLPASTATFPARSVAQHPQEHRICDPATADFPLRSGPLLDASWTSNAA